MIFADILWPGLVIGMGLFSVWPIILTGLIIEFFFVRIITNLSLSRCLIADIAMNAASTLLGIVLIPLGSIIWEFGRTILCHYLLHVRMGTFDLVGWTGTGVIAVLINTLVEAAVLIKFCKQDIKRKGYILLAIANSLSIAAVCFYYITHPPH